MPPTAPKRATTINDSKSSISKVSKASGHSKSSRANSRTNLHQALSKEDELKLAKEKKAQMDELKEKYS